jgi:RND family efflux transporter MFP subunit
LIADLKVDAGHVVKEGDLLMSLDAELAELALQRVKADRAQAQAELAEAERLRTEAQALARGGSSSKSEAATRENAVQSRTAAVQRFDAQVREQTALVERHRLLAPFDGVISRKLTEVGEWVQTGTPVVELVETGHLRVDVQAPQEMFARLDDGVEVTVHLDAYPDREFAAKVLMRVPVKDATARTFLLRLAIEDPQKLAAPGMSARASFLFRGQAQVWQVPRDAVVRFADGTTKVWIVDGQGNAATARGRDVKLGASLSDKIEVLEGLDGAAQIVVRGNEALREGQRVLILPPEPTAAR